jgi:hypothetical protein
MPLPNPHPFHEQQVECHSASIGGSPAAAYVRAPFRCKLLEVGVVAGGLITTADCSIAVAINGTAIGGSPFTLPVAGAAAGQLATLVPAASTFANEDDVISFMPSGAGGASVPGSFFAMLRRA